MRPEDRPKRLLEEGSDAADASPETREMLRNAERYAPTAQQLASLRGRLGPLFEAEGGGGDGGDAAAQTSAGGSTSGGATAVSTAKLVASGIVALGVVGTLILWSLRPADAPGAPRTPSVPASSIERPAPPSATASKRSTAPVAPVQATTPQHEPAADLAPDDAAEDSTTTKPRHPAKTELELLRRAQDALPSEPAQALAAAREHAQHYPAGVFAQEREMIAVEALVKLGRLEAARRRGERFLAHYPETAHRDRLHTLLGL